MTRTANLMIRRYIEILSAGRFAEPLFQVLCCLNALLALGVTVGYYYQNQRDATTQLIMGILFVALPSLLAFLIYKALRYSIGREHIEDALRATQQGRYQDAFDKLYGFKTPVNPELLKLPTVSYIFGIVLKNSGDSRSAVFLDYAALRDADYQGERGQDVSLSTITAKLAADLNALSKNMFFNAIEHEGFLRLVLYIAAGSTIVHLLHLVLMLF